MEGGNKDIAIYIPDAEAQKWLVFQEHYEVFSVLVEHGVFKQKRATISLYFDENGVLQTVNRQDTLFKKGTISPTG